MSYAQFHPSELGKFGSTILNLLSMLRLVTMETNVGNTGNIIVHVVPMFLLVFKHQPCFVQFLIAVCKREGTGFIT